MNLGFVPVALTPITQPLRRQDARSVAISNAGAATYIDKSDARAPER